MKIKQNIVITSIARNIEQSFAADYNRITESFSDFNIVRWIIIESNSTDNSRETLKTFAKKYRIVETESLERRNSNHRTEELAVARNRYIQIFNMLKNDIQIDYLVVCDLNNLNNKLNIKSVRSCWDLNGWAAVTANQSGPYYDIFALRHKYWNSTDCWESYNYLTNLYKQRTKIIWDRALWDSVYSKMINIKQSSNWIRVESAFGGLAIYNTKFLQNCEYIGTSEYSGQKCEHVSFNNGIIANGGEIFINPKLINFSLTDHSRRRKYFIIYNSWYYVRRVFIRKNKKAQKL